MDRKLAPRCRLPVEGRRGELDSSARLVQGGCDRRAGLSAGIPVGRRQGRAAGTAGRAAQPEAKGKPLLVVKEPINADVPSSLPQAAAETLEDYTLRRPAGTDDSDRRPAAQKTNFQLTGLFRGRYLVAATGVDLQPARPGLLPAEGRQGWVHCRASVGGYVREVRRPQQRVGDRDRLLRQHESHECGREAGKEQALDAPGACLVPDILPHGTNSHRPSVESLKERPGNGWVDDKPVWGPAAWDGKKDRLMGS